MKRDLSFRKNLKQDQKPSKPHETRQKLHIIDFLSNADWSGLRLHLSTKDGITEIAKTSRSIDANGQHVLHTVCQKRPPVDVVHKLVDGCPKSVTLVNLEGQTPLHLAARAGASPKVIRMLVNRYPQAASIRDFQGKTPLLLACELRCSDAPSKRKNVEKWWLIEVARALCSACPESAGAEDEENLSALNYVVAKGGDDEVVQILKSSSELIWTVAPDKMKGDTENNEKPTLSVHRKCDPSTESHGFDANGPQYVPFFKSAEEHRSEGGKKCIKKVGESLLFISGGSSDAQCSFKKNVRARSA